MRRTLVFGAALAMLLPGAARAQVAEPVGATVESDRPGICVGGGIVAAGHWQLETGITWRRAGDATPGVVGEVSVRIPVASDVEIGILPPSYTWDVPKGPGDDEVPSQGFLDPSLTLKWRILEKAGWGTGLQAGVVFPVGTKGLAAPGFQGFLTLFAERTLEDGSQVTFNAGWGSFWQGDRYGAAYGGVLLERSVAKDLTAFGEIFGWSSTGPGKPASGVVQAGVQWLAGGNILLDVRVGTGIGAETPDFLVGAGVGVLF